MVKTVAPTRSRRLPFWAVLVALVVCVLSGVFVVLWIKLPTWAPELVVEQSPWVDPIVRAVEADDPRQILSRDRLIQRARQRLLSWGSAAVPALLARLDADSWTGIELALPIFSQVKDDRIIQPLLDYLIRRCPEIEELDKGGLGYSRSSSQLGSMDRVGDALLNQRHDLLVDGMLLHFHGDNLATALVIELAGRVADERIVPALRVLVWEGRIEGFTNERVKAAFGSRGAVAAAALIRSPLHAAIPTLLPAFSDPSVVVRQRAVFAVTQLYGEKIDARVGEAMCIRLSDADAGIRRATAKAMAWMAVAGAEEGLITLSLHPDAKDRSAAIEGLGSKQATQRGIEQLIGSLRDPEEEVQWSAVRSLASTNNDRAIQPLLDVMQTGTFRIRREAVYELGRRFLHKDPRVFSALLTAIDDPVNGVSEVAEMVLTGKRLPKEQQATVDSAIERQKLRRAPRDQGSLSD